MEADSYNSKNTKYVAQLLTSYGAVFIGHIMGLACPLFICLSVSPVSAFHSKTK